MLNLVPYYQVNKSSLNRANHETTYSQRRSKKAGFKIREIKELIDLKEHGAATCRVGRDIALDRIAKVDQQIASLREIREILEDFASRCEVKGLDQPCSLSFNLECSEPD